MRYVKNWVKNTLKGASIKESKSTSSFYITKGPVCIRVADHLSKKKIEKVVQFEVLCLTDIGTNKRTYYIHETFSPKLMPVDSFQSLKPIITTLIFHYTSISDNNIISKTGTLLNETPTKKIAVSDVQKESSEQDNDLENTINFLNTYYFSERKLLDGDGGNAFVKYINIVFPGLLPHITKAQKTAIKNIFYDGYTINEACDIIKDTFEYTRLKAKPCKNIINSWNRPEKREAIIISLYKLMRQPPVYANNYLVDIDNNIESMDDIISNKSIRDFVSIPTCTKEEYQYIAHNIWHGDKLVNSICNQVVYKESYILGDPSYAATQFFSVYDNGKFDISNVPVVSKLGSSLYFYLQTMLPRFSKFSRPMRKIIRHMCTEWRLDLFSIYRFLNEPCVIAAINCDLTQAKENLKMLAVEYCMCWYANYVRTTGTRADKLNTPAHELEIAELNGMNNEDKELIEKIINKLSPRHSMSKKEKKNVGVALSHYYKDIWKNMSDPQKALCIDLFDSKRLSIIEGITIIDKIYKSLGMKNTAQIKECMNIYTSYIRNCA